MPTSPDTGMIFLIQSKGTTKSRFHPFTFVYDRVWCTWSIWEHEGSAGWRQIS